MIDPVSSALPIPTDQRKTDTNYLRALSIFHYLLAAFNAVILICLAGSMVMMARITSKMNADMAERGQPSLMHPWWRDSAVMLAPGGLYGTVMILNAISGWCIARRRAWTFSVVVAGLDLLYLPLGTVLGIFTLIVLLRGSVSTLYAESSGISRAGPVVSNQP